MQKSEWEGGRKERVRKKSGREGAQDGCEKTNYLNSFDKKYRNYKGKSNILYVGIEPHLPAILHIAGDTPQLLERTGDYKKGYPNSNSKKYGHIRTKKRICLFPRKHFVKYKIGYIADKKIQNKKNVIFDFEWKKNEKEMI